MTTMNNCPFCDSNQQYRYISEGELIRAIYPKAPAIKYHVLIVPKRHVSQFDSLNEEEGAEAFACIKKLNAAAKAKLPDYLGYNLLSNNGGPSVRQHVPHCHMHMFLRVKGETADPFASRDSAAPTLLTEKQLDNMKVLRTMMAAG